jgi:3D-(3,5/4)-trihydroxycyclohexane-1,2-dione acylhydrolase (decyclizing)
VLIEAVEHGVRGMIVISDNRRMAVRHRLVARAIHLESRTNDRLAATVAGMHAVSGADDAEALRAALKSAHGHDGPSLVHVPVYCGPDELDGLGAWGQWNGRPGVALPE